MRFTSLYTKLLSTFLGLLLLVQLLVMLSFFIYDEREGPRPADSHVRGLALSAQNMARTAIALAQERQKPLPQALQELSEELARIMLAKVWVQSGDAPPIQSFAGPLPAVRMDHALDAVEGAPGPVFFPQPERQMLINIPLEAASLPQASLFLLLPHPPGPPQTPPYLFFVRLVLICLLVSLLVIPLARFITKPLKQLRRSALLIASGNLSHRAHVSTRDEIGDLAQSFNHMTARLRQMIMASRELLAYVSHELRSPLARITVAGQLLSDGLEGETDSPQTRYLGDIREEIEQMDNLLAQILLLSRLDLQQTPFKLEALDFSELLQQQAAKWAPLMGYHQRDLELDIAPGASLRGDGEALASAISNLLDNAVKHAQGQGAVRLSLTARDNQQWLLCISNPAASLTREELEAIFLPFHRSPGVTVPGSGLGLALTRKILQAHGGEVSARYGNARLVVKVVLPRLA